MMEKRCQQTFSRSKADGQVVNDLSKEGPSMVENRLVLAMEFQEDLGIRDNQ